MDDTERFVTGAVFHHHNARMLIFFQQLGQLFLRIIQLEIFHIMARGHDAAHRTLRHAQHAFDHMAFLLVENLAAFIGAIG
ncbi:hypothetical protein D3C87_2124350 [compost metagenome]